MSGEICGCSAHLRHIWSRVYKQIEKAGSRLWGLKYVPSQCSLIKIPIWISCKFVACHLKTCEIFGSFTFNKIWNSMLTSNQNCDYNLSCFLNCVPRYHCLLFIFATADVNIIWEGNLQRVNASSWTHHLCCQGGCKPFPTSKSLAASTPVLFLWHLCITKKSMLLCWLSFCTFRVGHNNALCLHSCVIFVTPSGSLFSQGLCVLLLSWMFVIVTLGPNGLVSLCLLCALLPLKTCSISSLQRRKSLN